MTETMTFEAAARPPAPRRPLASTYRWYACELVSGGVLNEFPVVPSSALKHTIGRYDTCDFGLPIPAVSPKKDWITATQPGRTMLVCERVEDQVIVWGCMVLARERGSEPVVSLSGVTLEGYLDRRWVGTHTFADVDEGTIASAILADVAASGIGYTISSPNTGTRRDRSYNATQLRSAYAELQALMGISGGPEWTVSLAWGDDSHSWVRKTFRLAKRLGTAADPAAGPPAVFDYPGSIESYKLREDYSSDKGANQTRALSDGEGASQPLSDLFTDESALANGAPLFQYAESYSGVGNRETLNQYAAGDLAVLKNGAQILTLTAVEQTAPKVISAWDIGDDIGVHVTKSYGHPKGATAIGRALGWELEVAGAGARKVTPILWGADA
jgi:hypothetical protein